MHIPDMQLLDINPALAKGRRVLILTTWADDGQWHFLNRLRELGATVDLLEPPLLRSKWAPARLKRFLVNHGSFIQSVRALLAAKRYDAVATWNTRSGTTLGFLSRLLPKRLRPIHLLRDFHLDLTRFADPAYFPRVLLVHLARPGITAFLTTSNHEADLYGMMFHIPSDEILFFPDTPGGGYLTAAAPEPGARSDYVFAYGNSDRDFDALIAAAPDIASRIVILSQNYAPPAVLPPNVTFISRRIPLDELKDLIARAAVVVIPTKSHFVAAGQNAMLEVMCLKRPLVVTSNLTTLEHATHGVDALFYPPRDREALAAAVNRLLGDPALAKAMGENARRAAVTFPEKEARIFLDVLDRLLKRRNRDIPDRTPHDGNESDG
jgi:glycosyltransferase involved in cell wall biosynthesis